MKWMTRLIIHPYHDPQRAERIAALWNNTHHGTTDDGGIASLLFLPSSFLWNHVISSILITFLLVSLLYYLLLQHFSTILNRLLQLYPPTIKPTLLNNGTTGSNHHPVSDSSNNNKNVINNSNSDSNNHHHNHNSHPNTTSPPVFTFTSRERQKLCYQMTNFLVNGCFSGLGLYYEWVYLPRHAPHGCHEHHHHHDTTTTTTMNRDDGGGGSIICTSSSSMFWAPPHTATLEDTIVGYDALVYISAGQIGYQLWSIPIGIILIKESLPMIIHHVTVILCAGMSGFLRYGFRYYTPFFYGIVEISSLPLAIMNAFKDHPRTLQYYYPVTNATVRYLFAAFFLYIRIVLFIPTKYYFLRDHILLWTSIQQRYRHHTNVAGAAETGSSPSPNDQTTMMLYQCFMAIVSFSAFFLLLLQIYWAALIIKGFTKLLLVRRKNGSTVGTTQNKNDKIKVT